jgi:hypothetical protein
MKLEQKRHLRRRRGRLVVPEIIRPIKGCIYNIYL